MTHTTHTHTKTLVMSLHDQHKATDIRQHSENDATRNTTQHRILQHSAQHMTHNTPYNITQRTTKNTSQNNLKQYVSF